MKLKLTFASLLLAALAPFTASAQTPVAIPGEVGNVTFALKVSYEAGGFNGSYEKSDSPEKSSYKSVIVTERYSNKEFIADMIARYSLTGSAADYSIKYVKSDEVVAYFIVNKDGTSITCIGAEDTRVNDGENPISTYYTTGDYTDSEIFDESSTDVRKTNGDRTEKGSFKSLNCGTYLYFNPKNGIGGNGAEYFECFSLVTRSGSYTTVYPQGTDTTVETNRTGETKYTDITGTDYDGRTMSGSFTISALKSVADVRAYVDAYERRFGV